MKTYHNACDACDRAFPIITQKIRILPFSNGFANLCSSCFQKEIKFRKRGNAANQWAPPLETPKWADLQSPRSCGETPPSQQKQQSQ